MIFIPIEKYDHLPKHEIDIEEEPVKIPKVKEPVIETQPKEEPKKESKKGRVNLAELIVRGKDSIVDVEIEYEDYIIECQVKPLSNYSFLKLTKFFEEGKLTDYAEYLAEMLTGSIYIDDHFLDMEELKGLPTQILYLLGSKVEEISDPSVSEKDFRTLLRKNSRSL